MTHSQEAGFSGPRIVPVLSPANRQDFIETLPNLKTILASQDTLPQIRRTPVVTPIGPKLLEQTSVRQDSVSGERRVSLTKRLRSVFDSARHLLLEATGLEEGKQKITLLPFRFVSEEKHEDVLAALTGKRRAVRGAYPLIAPTILKRVVYFGVFDDIDNVPLVTKTNKINTSGEQYAVELKNQYPKYSGFIQGSVVKHRTEPDTVVCFVPYVYLQQEVGRVHFPDMKTPFSLTEEHTLFLLPTREAAEGMRRQFKVGFRGPVMYLDMQGKPVGQPA